MGSFITNLPICIPRSATYYFGVNNPNNFLPKINQQINSGHVIILQFLNIMCSKVVKIIPVFSTMRKKAQPEMLYLDRKYIVEILSKCYIFQLICHCKLCMTYGQTNIIYLEIACSL